jgi:hypothetical protein
MLYTDRTVPVSIDVKNGFFNASILLRLGFKFESETEKITPQLPSYFRDPEHFRSRSGFPSLI